MKYQWVASFAFLTGGQAQSAAQYNQDQSVRNTEVSTTNCTERNVAGGNQDTGGTCRGAADIAGYTEGTMFASMGHYMANTGMLACDTWRGNTTCQSGICFCAEEGVCAVNGQCGGRIGTMTCGGTSNGLPCQFPFEYLGVEYDDCTTEGTDDNTPWCYVAGGVRWGNCECTDDCFDVVDFIDARGYNCSAWEGFYCPGAAMYGYLPNQTDAILENCPLTCQECFPPAMQPGSGDTVEYKVTGSVSFTVPQSQVNEFVADSAVQAALATAMHTLAGGEDEGLVMGGADSIVIDLVTGGDVVGLTVFCELSDCDVGMVLKLESQLPSSCAGSACTNEECCVAPPTCTAAACVTEEMVLKTVPPVCGTAECSQDECCDWRGSCTSDVCPDTHVMMDDTPLCALMNCTSSECCEAKGTCGSTGMTTAAPSAGPSAGPMVFSANWMGCPAASHVDKMAADVPDMCDGAMCTVHECCDMRGTCNVTSACDEDTHVPKDRDGEPCEAADCTTDECCDPRGTCTAAVCSAITATHVFADPGMLCWGAECTEPECCALRAACSVDTCGTDMRAKAGLAANFLCAGAACNADECCEYSFDGYRRTSVTLQDAIADTADYSTAADAIAHCTADSDCDGITCAVTANGMATGPCNLKQTGATAAGGTTHVSFMGVTCSSSDCNAATQILKLDPPDTCAAACTALECCDDLDTCTGFDCGESHVAGGSVTGGGVCAGTQCLLGECCAPKGICAASDCTEGTHVPKVGDALPTFCAGTSCDILECCHERAMCADVDVCGDTHIIKPPLPMPIGSSGRCLGAECTLGECCNARAVCQESICSNTEVFEVQVALCAGTRCNSDECCMDRATCDASACGDTHVLLPEGDSNRVALCESSVCTPDECCQPKGQCSAAVCFTNSSLMDDYPPLCEGATCRSDECCDLCPFVGSWQSTNVFGGDALVVLEAPGRDSGYEVQIANMPSIAFGFVIERTAESTAECQCKIMLDTLTIAAGEMSESTAAITWDTILNNDVWERQAAGSRRLKNYEVNGGTDRRMLHKIIFDKIQRAQRINRRLNIDGDDDDFVDVFPQERARKRRLQQQDVRMDFEMQTATDGDAMTLQGMFEEMELWQIEEALRTALEGTNYTIGSVYMKSDVDTETVVTPGQRTSWAARSAGFWTWMPVFAIVTALFSV